MKLKKGFAFIETIVTVVVLSASLLYLYNSYNAIISDEEDRLYYDDVAYIYKTNYVRKFLEEYSNIEQLRLSFQNSYVLTIGFDYQDLFSEEKNDMFTTLANITNSYNINQMLIIKTDFFNECFDDAKTICKNSYENISYNMKKYINTLNDTSYNYYLVVEYTEKLNEQGLIEKCNPGSDKGCKSYYAALGINVWEKNQEVKS